MKKTEELVVITKTYDLILWSCNHTCRFPRNQTAVDELVGPCPASLHADNCPHSRHILNLQS